jgi:hypothetical protein
LFETPAVALGLVVSVVSLLDFDGCEVVAVLEEAAVVVPGDPFGGFDLDVVEAMPGTPGLDQLGLVQPDHGLGQGVVVGGVHRTSRGFDASGVERTPKAVRAQLDHVAETLAVGHPRVAQMLRDAKADVTAFSDFPQAHWRKVWSTNPLERLNTEVKRRTDGVEIFACTDALPRLSSCVLIEGHDEW